MSVDQLTGAVETTDAIVIGGGVVGCAVLRELAVRGVEAILLEAEPDVGEGTSKANSAIIHTGFDAKPGTIEAGMLRRAADRWPSLFEELAVPSLRCGALMIARTTDEAGRLRDVAAVCAENGIGAEAVDRAWLREVAPYVTPEAVGALNIPDEAIVDPFWLTRAYAEAAIVLGARVLTGVAVTSLQVGTDGVDVGLADGRRVRARQAFDCAGLWADDIARLAGDTSFTIRPRKGQFLVSERTYEVDRIVVPIPGPLGKGMLVTPIVFGGLLLGPTAEDGDDKNDRSTSVAGRQRIFEACRGLVPDVERMDPIRSFAGVRAVSSTGDFIIRPSTAGDRLTIVAGIRSTGISASPAIAEAAVAIAASARQWPSSRTRNRVRAVGPELAVDAGPIVCVCRAVGAAEVDVALRGLTPVTTTDALKRRCGVGFGDCQGNRCLAEAVERIAMARGVDPSAVEKGLAGSWILTEDGDRVVHGPGSDDQFGGSARVPAARSGDLDAGVDVAVVGGGMAGIGAAVAAAAAGLQVTVVDRGRRPGGGLAGIATTWWTADEHSARAALADLIEQGVVRWWPDSTVVGLAREDGRWQLDVQATDGVATVVATVVVLATGGYVTPRDHLAIDGPRPSGVMTADFVSDALDRGWRPARRVIVTGAGRLARGTAQRLTAAGIEVVEPVVPMEIRPDVGEPALRVRAVRGERRLDAVQIDDRWVAVDGLVLAHALRPATFLIRGLGIGDDRPGVPMPADATGALPMADLWAAGTCVKPVVDHDRSLDDGAAVGRALVAAIQARDGATQR